MRRWRRSRANSMPFAPAKRAKERPRAEAGRNAVTMRRGVCNDAARSQRRLQGPTQQHQPAMSCGLRRRPHRRCCVVAVKPSEPLRWMVRTLLLYGGITSRASQSAADIRFRSRSMTRPSEFWIPETVGCPVHDLHDHRKRSHRACADPVREKKLWKIDGPLLCCRCQGAVQPLREHIA
jgi:hypothetical protein